MLLLTIFTLFADARKTPIASGYRPDWQPIDGGEYHCAAAWLSQSTLGLGETCEAILQPLAPELWKDIAVPGALIYACEGPKPVGLARVIQVFDGPQPRP
jgi:hypothetical protein